MQLSGGIGALVRGEVERERGDLVRSAEPAERLEANAIGDIVLTLQQPLAVLPFARSRALGSLVLVDTASHKTSAAVLIQ